jgi:hypothetical protein
MTWTFRMYGALARRILETDSWQSELGECSRLRRISEYLIERSTRASSLGQVYSLFLPDPEGGPR